MKKSIEPIKKEMAERDQDIDSNEDITMPQKKEPRAMASEVMVGIMILGGLMYPLWPFFFIPLFLGLPVMFRGIMAIWEEQFTTCPICQ